LPHIFPAGIEVDEAAKFGPDLIDRDAKTVVFNGMAHVFWGVVLSVVTREGLKCQRRGLSFGG
jgi:hypothetical protein